MIKFVCSTHKHVELEASTVHIKHKTDRIAIAPCPDCQEFARRSGKQYVYNTITRNLSNMIAEKEEDKEDD